MRRWVTRWKILSLPLVAGLLVWGCGSSGGSGLNQGSGGSGTSATGGSLNLGGGTSTGGTASGGSSTINPDAACATETAGGQLSPLAMDVLLDRSSSMGQNNKWTDAKQGLSDFVDDPATAGIKIAFGFFPNPNADCDGTGYTTPLVPMGLLPGNGASIKNAMNTAQLTHLGTPIQGALNGLRLFTANYSQQHPAETTIGVLITDGQPNGCSSDSSVLTGIVAQAFGSTPPNRMYMVGMDGADFTLLDRLAVAGGTQKAFNISQGGAQAFVQALKSIAGSALPCDLAVPTSQTGTVDPKKINVDYTNGSGATQELGQVTDAAQCVPNAWYYDNNQNPTRIILCPDTCTAVRAQASGKIQIVLGCQTIAPPPPA